MKRLAGVLAVSSVMATGAWAQCVDSFAPELEPYVERMAVEGWTAKNRERGLMMLGCAEGQETRACLGEYPLASAPPYSQSWLPADAMHTVRILAQLDFRTVYWMRSSADGRYVGNGLRVEQGGFGSYVTDLTDGRNILTTGRYDPGFFADNSGFTFHRGNGIAAFCRTSALDGVQAIDFSGDACFVSRNIGPYQQVGASLDGGDYFVLWSDFAGDPGTSLAERDPVPEYGARARLTLTPMVNDGSAFGLMRTSQYVRPYEGDWAISPSGGMLVSRIEGRTQAGQSAQYGYRVRLLNAMQGQNGYSFTTPEAATICARGSKVGISLDERWITFHHYVEPSDFRELGFQSPDDPAFRQMLAQGTANLYLYDLKMRTKRRLTSMPAGQFALYPHFRSDGWLYFLVRDHVRRREYVAATDAAL